MKRALTAIGIALLLGAAPLATAGAAETVELLPDGLLTPTTDQMVPENAFRKDPPWTIGMSFGGVGNSWIVQMIQEAQYTAAQDPRIGEFIFVEANWQPAKQVADVEDLITRKVDALIVGPIAFPLVKNQVDAAVAAGIPVITFGASEGELNSTTEIMGGGEDFGRVGGEFLREKLGGKGTVWAFRGVAGVGEETARYNGFVKALEGTDIRIGAEVFGDWNYAKAKQLCENLVLSGQPVDGIWFSGAEMTRACIDVFRDTGKPMVPMTGEGNNGFLKVWADSGIDSVAPVFTPGLGPAVVRAAIALLEGKPLYKSYFSSPPPIGNAEMPNYVRPDLNDAFWVPSMLPEEEIQKTFKR